MVGVGGLGSPVSEQLVRMGTGLVTIADVDLLDTPSNVRRVFGSTVKDLDEQPPRSKVDVVGDHLDRIGLGRVRRIVGDVRSEMVSRSLLDADVVVAATDTHSSRAALNDLAYAYLLPVIDVGVRAGSKVGHKLAALTAEVRVLTPQAPCLWCRGAISADVIRAENLPEVEHKKLVVDGYLPEGVGEPAPSVVALTVLGSALATCSLLTLLSDEGAASPAGFLVDGFVGYAMETGPTAPHAVCRCRRMLSRGDGGIDARPGGQEQTA